jgi:hypothetical protein
MKLLLKTVFGNFAQKWGSNKPFLTNNTRLEALARVPHLCIYY